MSNQVLSSQTSRFISVPGQNPGGLSWGDSVGLWLQSIMMADVWWRRSGIRIRLLEEFALLRFDNKLVSIINKDTHTVDTPVTSGYVCNFML